MTAVRGSGAEGAQAQPSRRAAALFLLAGLLASTGVGLTACGEEGPSAKLIADLNLLARGAPLPEDRAEKIASSVHSDEALDALIDAMLKDNTFARRVAPGLIIGPHLTKPDHPVSDDFVLQQEGEGPYYLRAPCADGDAVDVVPWWSDEPVRVCQDAVKADVVGDGERQCGALHLRPADSEVCGCGPALIRCFASQRHYFRVRSALNAELRNTIADVVQAGRPVADVFTQNETVRGRDVEAVYARARIVHGDEAALAALKAFDPKPRPVARQELIPGQHAGILTAPSLVYASDASRGVLRTLYDLLWCTGHASARVDTNTLLGLDVVDLRVGDGWKQLAEMPVCTDCHARLDYGMQFFRGYPSAYNGVDFVPEQSLVGTGPLFAGHIGDHRGEAPLTPQGFAQLATGQDEFGQCMSQRVLDHVFHGQQTAEDQAAVLARFVDDGSLKGMMATALRRWARRAASGTVSPQAAAASSSRGARSSGTTGPASDLVDVGPVLRAALDVQCVACHERDRAGTEGEAGATLPDLSGNRLDRSLVRAMADRVASGLMPPAPDTLDPPRRLALTQLLIDAGWAEPSARAAARHHFLHGGRGRDLHEPYAALNGVARRAGQRGPGGWLLMESFVGPSSNTLTPGWAATVGLEALSACRKRGLSDAALADCVDDATRPDAFTLP